MYDSFLLPLMKLSDRDRNVNNVKINGFDIFNMAHSAMLYLVTTSNKEVMFLLVFVRLSAGPQKLLAQLSQNSVEKRHMGHGKQIKILVLIRITIC